jgi:hypothetical protein
MIPKSEDRFSEKIMLKQNARGGMTIRRKVIPHKCRLAPGCGPFPPPQK